MAARWGAGEEILTACTMDFFPLETLDEAPGLSSVESLETLQSCLDPSIRSIFEDIPPVESKGLDDESEAMLLTVLTEMLDGVDDETLSPFDTLPETDLLSNQRGGELSPLKRILSRSPQEKNPLCSARTLSTGKSRSRILAGSVQRSDGEEEEDGSLTLSPDRLLSSPGSDLLDWGGLTLPLPVGFEQEGEDGLSVSLGDLVRHMHPYCMSISVENEQGEQILPEGGILLEVVDQGENGEPILAIPNMDLPDSVPLPEIAAEDVQSLAPVPDEPEEQANDSSEHIVVDDDDDDETVNKAPITMTISVTPELCLDGKDKMVMKKGKRKEEIKAKSPTRRKKKLKEQQQSKSVEGRVLRSGTVTKKVQESQEKPEKKSVKQEKRVSLTPTPLTFLKPKEVKSKPTTRLRENTAATRLPKVNEKVALPLASTQNKALLDVTPEKSQPICSVTPSSPKPREMPEQPVNASAGAGGKLAAPSVPLSPASSESPAAASRLATPDITPSVSAPPAVPEPKTKSLSLAEYRRLREQKKPTPAKKQDDNSTKWPSLPELPKELPPIPCLPNPNPTDPRRPGAQVAKKEEEEVKPAWQPRGPCAPPTPEALLVPPAYMISSSSKTAATAPKPQQAPCKLPPKPPAPAPTPVKNLATHSHTTTQPSLPSGPPSSVAPASAQLVSSANGKCSLVLSGGKAENVKLPQVQHVPAKNVYLPKSCHVTTTDVIKPAVATTPIVPQRNSAVSLMPTEVSTSTHLNNPVKSDSKSPKITTGVTQSSSSSSAAAVVLSGSRRPSPLTLQQLETKKKVALAVKLQKAKTPTQELIESFTTEIGIEASDLTSLLEQFEETQAKVEKCVPEVSGRAAAVGNSSIPEKSVVERLKADDISSTAALTPPATPPHQMWKPLAPVALLGKSRTAETPKSSPSKVIQIEAQPLPSFRSRSKPTPAAAPVSPELACLDHDYCLPNKGTAAADPSKRWNVKQRSFITIKPIQEHAPATTKPLPAVSNFVIPIKKQPQTECTVQKVEDRAVRSSVLETPEASPSHQGSESTFEVRSPRRGHLGRSYRQHASSHSPSPSCNPRGRTGRCEKRSRRSPSPMSSCSDSYSSRSRSRSQSRSRSPAKKRYRRRDSDRSSDSSSRSSSRSSASSSRSPPRKRRYSYSSSRSGSWSRSRSRSLSPQRRTTRRRNRQLRSPSYQSSYSYSSKTDGEEVKRRKESAIEERRVVYVGRIRGTMTQKELRERFSLFGEVEECTLHFRDHGDNYGFVTYYDTKDAFTAIENGSKLRKPDELPFDLCFGGRRQFCQASYADLDSSREYDAVPTKGKFHALDFDTLLKQAQANQKR
ncbi:peroxisome proliferator-activated receptor gamma coactivator-related protein 1 [Cololabis saira]|uniref:peroxisome proliferator-activated receptor gamma coactivator-related protein 1 n=1 Tax=Cololabis saira TaxID=129043 RepID=UPI002AD1ECC6|nr:peroxisome proliferator-activated receptor gamma coactivator-related protein 1 [Cololabis saira]